jgi:hypothetical protein
MLLVAGQEDVSSLFDATEVALPIFDAHDEQMEQMIAAATAEAQAAATQGSCNARPVTGITCYISSGRGTTLTGIRVTRSSSGLSAPSPRGRLLAQALEASEASQAEVKESLAAAVALEAASTIPHPSEIQEQQAGNSSSTKRVIRRRSFASGGRGSVCLVGGRNRQQQHSFPAGTHLRHVSTGYNQAGDVNALVLHLTDGSTRTCGSSAQVRALERRIRTTKNFRIGTRPLCQVLGYCSTTNRCLFGYGNVQCSRPAGGRGLLQADLVLNETTAAVTDTSDSDDVAAAGSSRRCWNPCGGGCGSNPGSAMWQRNRGLGNLVGVPCSCIPRTASPPPQGGTPVMRSPPPPQLPTPVLRSPPPPQAPTPVLRSPPPRAPAPVLSPPPPPEEPDIEGEW